MAKRTYIELDKIEIYGGVHTLNPDGSFTVDEKNDGKSTEDHIRGIEEIRALIDKGHKILPPLVRDNGDGTYKKLDGFKRLLAYKAAGWKYVEVFLCAMDEYNSKAEIPFENGEVMVCKGGGQTYVKFPSIFEANENGKHSDTILWSSPNLRIELRECIHIHWGNRGRYRLVLSRREFLWLAEAITSIPDQWDK